MYTFKFILLLIAICVCSNEAADKIVCYYQSWSAYNNIVPENLDANLCTHINYAFMVLQSDGNLKVNDDELDINQGLFSRVTGMKQKNPNLKVLISVGGASAEASTIFSQIVQNDGMKGAFIGSANYFITQYNFDGLDIDWEVPQAGDRDNYIRFLQDIKNDFSSKGWLLTAAVAADGGDGYDIARMNDVLDIINVMSYDMYGSWSEYTGQNSPLFASSVESDWEKQHLNLAASGNIWISGGASPQKIAMGVAFYGRSFTLADPNQHGIHAPINGPGSDGGYADYRDICQNYNDWTRVWDDEQKNPYKYSGNQWIGYDDEDSISQKADYINSNNIGGIMIWPIDGDDVSGNCGTAQALLKKINERI